MKLLAAIFISMMYLVGCQKQPPLTNVTAEPIKIAVAAAADLKYAFDEIAKAFQQAHPEIQIEPTYGSSGNFFAQLSNRAPFDMFLSADRSYPRKLIEQDLAVKDSEFQYATGHIVIWTRSDSTLDIEKLGMDVLRDSSIKNIAIANPKHAPYGRAVEAAMKNHELYDALKDRLVLGENVAQTMQFIETGAADIGIIAQSLALSPPLRDKGRFWLIPADSHPPLEQAGVTMNWTRNQAACTLIQEFLVSESGRSILQRYGFE